MSLAERLETLPDYARDLKLNLTTLLDEGLLTPQQRWGCALTAAYTSRNAELLEALEQDAKQHLTPEAMNAARIAASLMGMNNVYYRFQHLISEAAYRSMPAKLRMQAIARPGIEKADFELFCMVASAINGCGACTDSHERVVRQAGLSAEAIQAGVRLGAVLNGLAVALEIAPRVA